VSEPLPPGGPNVATPARSELTKLHPLTLALILPRLLLSYLWPIVIVYFISSKETAASRSLGYVGIAIGISLVAATIRYFTFRYGIVGDELIVERGILERLSRRIPLDRIHNVDLAAGPMQRAFGVVTLRIETAGGTGTEAELSVVGRSVAEDLRARLLAHRIPDATPQAPAETLLRRASFLEILLVGATENRAGAIGALLLAAWSFADDAGLPLRDWLDEAIAAGSEVSRLQVAATTAAIAVAILAAGWLASVVLGLNTWSGFTLSREGRGLRRRHGLITRFEAHVAIDRVQALIVEDNPLRRGLARALLRVRTAGSPGKGAGAGATVLFPLLRHPEIASLSGLLFDHPPVDHERLHPVHRLAIRRGFLVYLFLLATPLVAAAARGDVRFAWFVPLAALLAYVLARLRYAALGYAWRDGFLLARGGIWTRRTAIVPLPRIQALELRESPTQRRLGLASLLCDTAGPGGALRIVDLDRVEAERLFAALSRAAALAANDELEV
jgi:putative membrane protein